MRGVAAGVPDSSASMFGIWLAILSRTSDYWTQAGTTGEVAGMYSQIRLTAPIGVGPGPNGLSVARHRAAPGHAQV